MDSKVDSKQTVLITGSSRGIGKAIAEAFVDAGKRIVVIYENNREMAEKVAAYDVTGNSFSFQCDVSDRKSVIELKRFLIEKGIRLDTLVNNAGINRPNDFDKITDEDWERVMAVNLSGPFVVTQELLSLMKKGGSIINIASVSGQYGGPRTSHYAASKAGLISLTQNMAIFCGKKDIRVNAISPGLIESEMAGSALSLNLDDKILLGRLGKAKEVASVAVFLASDKASYITAQTINVNGGIHF